MSLALVDSGVANLTSVIAALQRLNVEATVTRDPSALRCASRVILPGVGSVGAAMAQLNNLKLVDTLRGLTQPVLGICLGMQVLFSRSEESNGCQGLDILQGCVRRLPDKDGFPVPHMGWNQIDLRMPDHPLLRGIQNQSYIYFVHSYAAPVSDATLASCTYGEPFTAVVAQNNFMGCQFHPERSGAVGSQILQNFLDL